MEDLFQSFIIAIFFIYLFKLHKELFSESYWATSDIISEVEQAPSRLSVVIRFLIILLYGIILNFFVEPNLIIFGITLGSFLIVWPVFLSDENIDESFYDQRFLLRSLLALFVVVTFITAKLSITLYNLGNEVLNIYFQDFNSARVINLIGDSLIWAVIMVIFRYISSYMRGTLNEKLTLSSNHETEEEEIEEEESIASEESIFEENGYHR